MELIKVNVDENGKKLVSAKELYLGLGLNKTHWAKWYKKNIELNEYFAENVDWAGFDVEINYNKTKDFLISVDFATHIINSAKTIPSKTKLKLLNSFGTNSKFDVISRKEIEFLEILESQLSVFGVTKFKKQYSKITCGNYRIDLYLPELNVAIEYDENNHKHYTYEQQELRQKIIEKELGCKFIRVSDENSHIKNSAIVIRNLMSYLN